MGALIDGMPASAEHVGRYWARPAVILGDVVLETIGVWDGRPFQVDRHLRRLRQSAAAMALPEPDAEAIHGEVFRAAADVHDDRRLRILLAADGARLVLADPTPARRTPRVLQTQVTPTPAGVAPKTLSYGPLLAARRLAQQAGADDALLVSADGLVLETPTAGVLWVVDGELRHPAAHLGIVPSTSVMALADLACDEGLSVRPGGWSVGDLAVASEMMVVSALRPVTAVTAVDQTRFPVDGPFVVRLAALLDSARRAG